MDDSRYRAWTTEVERARIDESVDAALDLVRSARERDPDPRLAVREGLVLSAVQRWSEAADLCVELESQAGALAGTPEAILWRMAGAQALQNAGRKEEALRFADAAVELDGAPPEAHYLRAHILRSLGHEGSACDAVPALDAESARSATTLAMSASDLRARGEYQAAMDDAREALAVDPQQPLALGELGLCHMFLGHAVEGRALLAWACEREPENSAWHRGWVECCMAMRDVEQALAVARGGARRFPEDVYLHGRCADALVALGRAAEALPFAQRATELEPSGSRWWVGLAYALLGVGKEREARDAVRRALSEEPTSPLAVDLARELGLDN